ncbi:LysR family transcriptional regulator [Rhizobium daejeonense]|uniref:HTH-type transcriptional regulator TtuA n=1 Tax=Rhizobium daejeonense TaxID=240521 RepID=A0A6M1S6H4_9HYPH|nr:LysR family transcriptional regulator [Rhizobium daejeonense]NGO66645.1 LysR family transcriptional regulator [Rhizobium daejeonense]
MSDRLEAMSMLLSVVDEGSLSAASRKLDIPLATISRRIGGLEEHLGTRLFQRAGRGLILTETGQEYVASCRRILEDVMEAERTAAGEYRTPKGSLTITAPVVFGRLHVLPVIVEFLKVFPEIDVRLIQSDRLLDIAEEHVDLAVRIGKLAESSLIFRNLGTIRRVVCASPDYLMARGVPRSLEDLADHDCISFESLMSSRSWAFRHGSTERNAPIHSRFVVDTAEAAIDAAMAGLGLARVLSYQVHDLVAKGSLMTVLDEDERDPWPVSIVYPSRGLIPKKVRAFLDFATPRLRSRLADRS